MKKSILSFILFSCLNVFAASTYYVSVDGTAEADCSQENPGTLAAALAKASAGTSWETGDTIIIKDGFYQFDNSSDKPCYTIDIPFLRLRSESGQPEKVLFVGKHSEKIRFRGFNVNGPAIIEGVTFTNFYSTYSGGALNASSSELGAVTVTNCHFIKNLTENAGTKYHNGPANGGIYIDCGFYTNTHSVSGGYAQGGVASDCVVINCEFIGNNASFGGGIGRSYATNCLFISNTGGSNAGAADASHAYGCTFISNSVTAYGGAMRGGSAINCKFIANSAKRGGAVSGTVTVDCEFSKNYSSGEGGAVYQGAHTNGYFYGNVGGGGSVGNGAKFFNCSVINSAAGSYGAFSNGCTVQNSFIYANTNSQYVVGGGIFVNCLIKDNRVTNDRHVINGGALINCTLVGNVPGSNYGVVYGSTITNTIFYGNTRRDTRACTFVSSLYQTDMSSTFNTNYPSQLISDSPFMEDRRPSAPYTPALNSPAINAGVPIATNLTCIADFYGNKRIHHDRIDIGCAEHWPLSPPTFFMFR